jgi:hypothetical protein
MIRRLRVRWRAWRHPHERCETCAAPLRPKRVHQLTAIFDDLDDDPEVPAFGGSSITATYCPDHCPGGCNRKDHHADPS